MSSAARAVGHAGRKSMAMGPSVRNLLSQYQLDANSIAASGPHQTLLKGDVLAFISQRGLKPGQSAPAKGAVARPQVYTPNLDLSGYQLKEGPENYSRIARELLDKYQRKGPTQQEIDVINNGGRI